MDEILSLERTSRNDQSKSLRYAGEIETEEDLEKLDSSVRRPSMQVAMMGVKSAATLAVERSCSICGVGQRNRRGG